MKLFYWGGIDWSLAMVPLRLLWIGAAVGLTLLATRFFDRFDPARADRGQSDGRKGRSLPAAADDLPSHPVPLVGLDYSRTSGVQLQFSQDVAC